MIDLYATRATHWGFDAYTLPETNGRTYVLHLGNRELVQTVVR